MKKKLLSFLLFFYVSSYAQCPFPTSNTIIGTEQTFCVDNPNQIINVANVNTSRFVLVNVVQGFRYNFSVGNVYTANTENLNVYNATTNASLVFASGASGATISNWTSTLSGQIKIVLSLDACVQTNTTNVTIAIELVSVGNTLDNQNAFGTDNWIGHVYNWLGTNPPPGGASPATPPNTFPFDSSSYVGYYTIPTENFAETFGGDNNCFPVTSNGSVRTNIRTEVFAVRYKMRSTRPSGCYIATFRADDGVRLYNDNALVFSQWQQQATTTYSNVLVFLDGSADLVLDYYEYQGGNIVDFSLTPFNPSNNAVTTPVNPIVCSGTTPSVLDGTTFTYNGAAINPTITFRWQSSTNNISFTDIPGATNEDYAPPAVTTTTSNVVVYYRRIVSAASNSSGCNYASNSVSITTTPANTSATATAGTGITCTSFTANWNAITGATSYLLDVSTNAAFSSFVTGYNSLNVGNVTTYSVTGLTSNTNYYYRFRANYTCGLSSYSNVITNTTIAVTAPTATAATAVTCKQFNANWNATANATSYILDVATTNTFTAGTFVAPYSGLNVGNVTSVTVASTASPVYYRVRAVSPCATTANSTVITVTPITTTWNGTAWSNGTPTLASAVIINGNYNTATLPSFDACSVRVNSPFAISIIANKNINIQNELTVNTGAAFNVQDDGSLVQTNDNAINTGTITFLRTTDLKLKDYVYWSSPVESFSVRNISINTPTSLFWKWNPSVANPNGGQGNWQNANETMVAGKGYIVRAPTGYSATVATPFTATFTGKPHNGLYTPTLERGSFTGTNYLGTNGTIITKTSDNWNLIGNPYPSAINAVDFLTANTNIDGTIRIWTHASAPSSTANPNYNSFTYNYSPTDYIVFNGTAATGGPHAFDGKIGAGQSFMVIMNDGPASTQTVTFNNAMRNKSYDNSLFYKSATALKKDSVSSPSRIWLDLISPTNEITRTVVGYVQGATQEKDRLFDARNNSEVGQNFYSLLDGEKMIIQGKALPLAIDDIVPMGMNLASTGEHIIAVASVDGVFENGNQTIYLLDKLNNVTHNLTNAPYKFEGNKGTVDNRFELRYVDTTLSTTDFDLIRNNIWVFGSNNGVEINSRLETIKSYQVYDVLGRVLETKNNVNANTIVASSIVKNNQALIVKITLENGLIVTKKMVY